MSNRPEKSADGYPHLPVPEPSLTPAEMIARAREMAPAVRADAPLAEKRGRYSESLHEQFRDAGFYRALQPRRFGGYEFSVRTYFQVMVEIATADPGIGWGLTLASGHALQVGSYFEPATQARIFGPSGHFVAPLSLPGRESKPACKVVPDGDGYRVSGRWPYASGSPYSTHFMGAAQVGDEVDTRVIVVVPREQSQVLDDWGNILGLKASGSNTVVIDSAWVPGDFVLPLEKFGPTGNGSPGSRFHGNPMYAGQFLGFGAGELAVSQVGAAKASLVEYERIIRTSRPRFTPGIMKFQHHDFQRIFGLGMSMTLAAEALLLHTADLFMEYSRAEVAGDPFTPFKAWQLMGLQHQSIRLAWEAGLDMFRAASSSNAVDGQPMQRFFRDLATFKNNAFHQADFVAPEIARGYFGLPAEILI
jgi:3-hydroxy-9,10-secoandrosta-1,3,5(10)-triene-9,17-dione monooxygenase